MQLEKPITLVEESVLLALDDQTGALRPMPVLAFGYVLAGALLSDLALAGRVDTDPEKLTVINDEATGDALLDDALRQIAEEKTPQTTAHWLTVLSRDARRIQEAAIERLVERGVLRREERKLLWVIAERRYPTVDNHERIEVLTRLAKLILGDALPEPRDAILISLLTGGGLAEHIFTGPTYDARRDRLETLARIDLVGREVGATVNSILENMNRAMTIGI